MGTWIRRATLLAALAALTGACGRESSTSVTAPSSRCGVNASAQPASVAAPGGTGAIVVATNRECAWEARSEADWLSLSSASGQGDGTVSFAAAANAQVVERRGTVVINAVRVEITQGPAPCVFTLDRLERSVGGQRGPGRGRGRSAERLRLDGGQPGAVDLGSGRRDRSGDRRRRRAGRVERHARPPQRNPHDRGPDLHGGTGVEPGPNPTDRPRPARSWSNPSSDSSAPTGRSPTWWSRHRRRPARGPRCRRCRGSASKAAPRQRDPAPCATSSRPTPAHPGPAR